MFSPGWSWTWRVLCWSDYHVLWSLLRFYNSRRQRGYQWHSKDHCKGIRPWLSPNSNCTFYGRVCIEFFLYDTKWCEGHNLYGMPCSNNCRYRHHERCTYADDSSRIRWYGSQVCQYMRMENIYIITGEYYCPQVAGLMRAALEKCVNTASGLMNRDPQGILSLTEGLILSGIAMSLQMFQGPHPVLSIIFPIYTIWASWKREHPVHFMAYR